MRVTRNVKVTGQFDGSAYEVEQDIGGWVVMPHEHYKALMRAVNGPDKPDGKEKEGF
jgi:hypothetical protein